MDAIPNAISVWHLYQLTRFVLQSTMLASICSHETILTRAGLLGQHAWRRGWVADGPNQRKGANWNSFVGQLHEDTRSAGRSVPKESAPCMSLPGLMHDPWQAAA